MKKTSRVCVTGPLEAYASGYRRELAGQGYSPWTALHHMHLLAHVSRWLVENRVELAAFDQGRVEQFLASRRAEGYARFRTSRGLIPLLTYLRAPAGTPAR